MTQERMRRSERERQSRYRYESSHQERTMEAETKNAIVDGCALLNFRSEPDMTNPRNIKDTLKRGAEVEVLEIISYVDAGLDVQPKKHLDFRDDHKRPMAKVRLEDGREGYVAYEFLKEV